MSDTPIQLVSSLAREQHPDLAFTILDISNRPVEATESEAYIYLLDQFPNSKVSCFEHDNFLCGQKNKESRAELTYHNAILSSSEDEREYYLTAHPACSSFYKPIDSLSGDYFGLEVMELQQVFSVTPTTLDKFAAENDINSVDYIRIDMQGAELDVFKAGTSLLGNAVIVGKTHFMEMYEGQPLYSDQVAFLTEHGMHFHKFASSGSRSLRPVLLGEEAHFGTQLMWTDSVFIPSLDGLSEMSPEKLAKLAIMADLFDSPDLAYKYLTIYAEKTGIELHKQYIKK